MLFKNAAGQKLAIYAHDTDADAPKTGDAANITARISKDGAAVAQSNDVTPAELDATHAKGIYIFDLTQAETNCDLLILSAASSTADVHIEPVIIYTQGGAVPKAAAGGNGGLPTVDANNRLAGIQGTINTLDALDTAQDARHDATQTAVGDVPTNAEFEARTLPTASYATAAGQTTISGYVDCLPATLDGSTLTNLPAVTLTAGERADLAAALEAAIINELDGQAVMQAIADLIADDMTTGDLSVQAIASAVRDAILDRVLSGNHDTNGTPGKFLQNVDATITSRHASGAAVAKSPATVDWDADVSNKPTIGTSTLDAAGVRTALGMAEADLDTQLGDVPTVAEFEARTLAAASYATAANQATIEGKIDTVDTNVDAVLADTGTDGVVVAAASKTGYALASNGLDSVAVTDPTDASDAASTFTKMVRWLFLRFWSKNTMTDDTLTTYKSDGSTSLSTQTLSDDSTTQTQGKAS